MLFCFPLPSALYFVLSNRRGNAIDVLTTLLTKKMWKSGQRAHTNVADHNSRTSNYHGYYLIWYVGEWIYATVEYQIPLWFGTRSIDVCICVLYAVFVFYFICLECSRHFCYFCHCCLCTAFSICANYTPSQVYQTITMDSYYIWQITTTTWIWRIAMHKY